MPPLTWREFLLWLLRRRRRFRVTERSMLPVLTPGTEVLIDPRARLHVDAIVVAQHPRKDLLIIKRVTHIQPDGRLILRGENPAASDDSRAFGPVAPEAVVGVVTCVFAAGE